ncbi:MAG: glycosyltransferase family protein [Coriobacteriia bacterium]
MILGVIQARYSSTRLPGKVLLPVLGRPMLALQIDRILRAETLDKVVVATSTDSGDDAIETLCAAAGVDCYRGSLDDVLGRLYGAAERYGAGHVVRVTGDCPLSDPRVIDAVVALHLKGGYEYTSNVAPPTFPDGLDVEVVRMEVLAQANSAAELNLEREHVTVWIREHVPHDRRGNLLHDPDLSALRWTVDEPADLEFVRTICGALADSVPEFGLDDILELLHQHPEYGAINAGIGRNEGFAKSVSEEDAYKKEGEV